MYFGYIVTIAFFLFEIIAGHIYGLCLVLVAALYSFVISGWIIRRRLNAVPLENSAGINSFKLSRCLQNMKINDAVRIYIISDPSFTTYTLGFRSIGISEGALNLDDKMIETLIAAQYGHILAGDFVLSNVLFINAFLLIFALIIVHAGFYILLCIVIGMFLFCLADSLFLSLFIGKHILKCSKSLSAYLRRFVFNIYLAINGAVCRKGQLIADCFVCRQGYGFYLMRYLKLYAPNQPDSTLIKRLSETSPSTQKRIRLIRKQFPQLT